MDEWLAILREPHPTLESCEALRRLQAKTYDANPKLAGEMFGCREFALWTHQHKLLLRQYTEWKNATAS